MKILGLSICIFLLPALLIAQLDKAKFITYPSGFYHNVIMQNLTKKTPDQQGFKQQKYFKMDFDGIKYPTDMSLYKLSYHNLPVSQGNSGTCWAYASTSFMESELFRQHNKKLKLSEMYSVYWEYMERVEFFVRTKGNVNIGEGSEANAILRIMKNYGILPYSVYSGLKEGYEYNNHEKLFEDFEFYLNFVKKYEIWDETTKIYDEVKKILDKHIGTPPEKFLFEGIEYSPKSFMTDYLKLEPNRYFSFMSTKEFPYNEKNKLEVFDNWWHCNDYYNLSLEDYYNLLNKAVIAGYTISICGDVSEPVYDQMAEIAVIPDFDIPSKYINENARQLRLSNNTTNDDHCIHIVGYQKVDEDYWYLIKDSGSGAFDGKNKGYRFYHEDYIRLKTISYIVHVDMAKIFLDKIIK